MTEETAKALIAAVERLTKAVEQLRPPMATGGYPMYVPKPLYYGACGGGTSGDVGHN